MPLNIDVHIANKTNLSQEPSMLGTCLVTRLLFLVSVSLCTLNVNIFLPVSKRLSILIFQDKMSVNEHSIWTLWHMLTELFIKH